MSPLRFKARGNRIARALRLACHPFGVVDLDVLNFVELQQILQKGLSDGAGRAERSAGAG
jgi:hypothetical protein